jgi:ribonuclease P protein subunit RPR2
MAKIKAGKKVPNKHIYARISYLHQAAHYLSNQQHASAIQSHIARPQHESQQNQTGGGRREIVGELENDVKANEMTANLGLPRELASHILAVSHKGVVKLSRELKQSICKRCTSTLVVGLSAESKVENKSRGGNKPWADVLVTTCLTCGMQKRYPVGSKRQPKRKERTSTS